AVAAHVNGRMRLLHRLRPGPDRIEIDVLPVIFGLIVRPDLLHGQDALAHERKPRPRIGPVVLHLLAVPTPADAEDDSPARDEIETRNLLRERDRVPLDDEADAGAEKYLLRRRRDRSQRNEQVVRVVVLLRQLGAARPRTEPAR